MNRRLLDSDQPGGGPPAGPTIVYFDDDPAKMGQVARSIANNSCVLILGPLFAKNSTGRTLAIELQSVMLKNGKKVDLDFQNLFITKDGDDNGYDMMNLMRDFYTENLDIHAIYKEIANIKFPAIICFTADSYLPQSFMSNGNDFQFNYYAGGVSGKFQNGAQETIQSAPLVYNIYGIYSDNNSLITTYGNYYKFLFSILGDDGFLPLDLKSRIGKAECFLLLGFDWKDPYIPLLISKIFRVAKDNLVNTTAIAAMNNTDIANTAFVSWLQRYPLTLKPVRDSYRFIEKIMQLAATYKIFKNRSDRQADGSTSIKRIIPKDVTGNYKKQISCTDNEQMMKDICDELSKWAADKDNSLQNLFINLSAQCSTLAQRKSINAITLNEELVVLNVIRKGALDIIDQFSEQ